MRGLGVRNRLPLAVVRDALYLFSQHPVLMGRFVRLEVKARGEAPVPQIASDQEEVAQLAANFRQLYEKLRAQLEAEFMGDHVVINVRTGDYVVGSMPDQAMKLAEQKFGSDEYCWSRRIGGR